MAAAFLHHGCVALHQHGLRTDSTSQRAKMRLKASIQPLSSARHAADFVARLLELEASTQYYCCVSHSKRQHTPCCQAWTGGALSESASTTIRLHVAAGFAHEVKVLCINQSSTVSTDSPSCILLHTGRTPHHELQPARTDRHHRS